MTLYLDCNATTQVDPRVAELVMHYMLDEYGNAGSPHAFGNRAKQAVHGARDQVGRLVEARRHEILFTSGATEANNLAILGLAAHGERIGKRHLVSTQIEHKAVLEPLEALRRRGFDVSLVPPQPNGRVVANDVLHAVNEHTLLISVIQVNNETGIGQPIAEIANGIADELRHDEVYFHVDAAQGFGKEFEPLRHQRIDMISISGHKIHAPKGIGALVARRRAGRLPPLTPLMHGGGQELGLRPGTLPVPLIAGLGLAAELAAQEAKSREEHCRQIQRMLLEEFESMAVRVHGETSQALPHVLNVSFPGLDATPLIEMLAGVAAVSDGSACTSICSTPSHVLSAMGIGGEQLEGAVRLSWSYLTDPVRARAAVAELCRMIATD
jgi:cysteine desulfurase